MDAGREPSPAGTGPKVELVELQSAKSGRKTRSGRKKSRESIEKDTGKSTRSVVKETSRTSKKKNKKRTTSNTKTKEKSEKSKKSKKREEKSSSVGIKPPAAEPPATGQSREGTIASLMNPPEGRLGAERLAQMLQNMPETEPPKTNSNVPAYLQKVSPIETGALLDLKCEQYFHFFLAEYQAWRLVRNPGEFLVRQLPIDEKTKDNDQDEYVICVMGNDRPITITIHFSSARNFCYINHLSFETPAALVAYHYRKHIALDDKGTRLLTPIRKDSIFINHAQIAFTNKTMPGSKNVIATIRTGFFTRINVTVLDYSNFTYEQGRLEDLFRITRIAKSLDHPNILKVYGIAMSEAPVYILAENCSQGTLGYLVRKPNGPDVGKREIFCYELAQAMKYLENRMIIHRMIAIDNIYVDSKNRVKIGEFSNVIFGAKINEKLGFVSPRHLAPEVNMWHTFTFKSDVWAFGVVVWEIFHNGRLPYEEIEEKDVFEAVMKKNTRLKCYSDKYPNKLWKISESCWVTEADSRPSMTSIVADMETEQRASTGLLDRVYESFALLME